MGLTKQFTGTYSVSKDQDKEKKTIWLKKQIYGLLHLQNLPKILANK